MMRAAFVVVNVDFVGVVAGCEGLKVWDGKPRGGDERRR
jgi:hypothetical protein